nr:bile acid:sodium symporter family protein [Nitrosomonas nitrosa]
MNYLKRLGFDTYMLLLVATATGAYFLPAYGVAADVLGYITYWAVALLFFLYGSKLDPVLVKEGLFNWRVQSLTALATYFFLPLTGLFLSYAVSPVLGAIAAVGFIYLSVLPSTVQSSIAFTSIAGGNVPAAICAASLSNLVGVFLTPAMLALLLSQSGEGVSAEAIFRIATQILVPFLIGQLARPWIGATVQRYRTATLVVDRGAILLIVYSAFSAGTVSGLWTDVSPMHLSLTVLFVVVFLTIALAGMALAGRISRMPVPDRVVLLFCGSTKSLATGLPMAIALFPADNVAAIVLPLMIYHMLQLLVCAYIAQRMSVMSSVAS